MTRPIRVPDGMATPQRTATGWDSSVSLPLDEDGFFGRECPASGCLAYFKLHVDEYDAARKTRLLSCPVCGIRQDDETFLTPDQIERTEAAAMELAQGAVEDAIDRAFGGVSRSSRSGAVTFSYTPGPPRIPKSLPTYVERQTIRTFTCPSGGHRAVIYDLLAVCPYCGPDTPPRAVLDDNMAAMGRVLAVVEQLPEEHRRDIEAAGGTTALAEGALGGGVAAVQTFAKQFHGQTGKPTTVRNPWQSVSRLQEQWQASFATDPLAALLEAEIKLLRLGFARRHILEHNGGVADEKYVEESGDSIPVGRRIRVQVSFVREFLAAVVRLADALEAAAP